MLCSERNVIQQVCVKADILGLGESRGGGLGGGWYYHLHLDEQNTLVSSLMNNKEWQD